MRLLKMKRISTLASLSACALFLCCDMAYGYSDMVGTGGHFFFIGGALVGSFIGAVIGGRRKGIIGGVTGFLAGGISGGVITVLLLFLIELMINDQVGIGSFFTEYSGELALFTVFAGGIVGGFAGGLLTTVSEKNDPPCRDGK
jgi:hypothetical protein